MIEANKRLFAIIDEFASLEDDPFRDPLRPSESFPLDSEGENRWVSFDLPGDGGCEVAENVFISEGLPELEAKSIVETLGSPTDFLKSLAIDKGASVKYSPRRMVAGAMLDDRPIVIVFGFENALDMSNSRAWEQPLIVNEPRYLIAGILALALDGKLPALAVSRAQLKDVVDAVRNGGEGEKKYKGHQPKVMAELFPPSVIVVGPAGESLDESFHNICFDLCLKESQGYSTWLDGSLISCLESMVKSSVALPRTDLAWAVLAHDPRQLFMELYRCLEATYAHPRVSNLLRDLEIDQPWDQVAKVLHTTLNWRATENEAIRELFEVINPQIVKDLGMVLGVTRDVDGVPSAHAVAKKIYQFRNSIVHYRPGLESVSIDDYDWCRICEELSKAVLDRLVKLTGVR